MVSDMAWGRDRGPRLDGPGQAQQGGKREHVVPLTDAVIDTARGRARASCFQCDGGKTPFKGFQQGQGRARTPKLAGIRKAAGRKPMPHFDVS